MTQGIAYFLTCSDGASFGKFKQLLSRYFHQLVSVQDWSPAGGGWGSNDLLVVADCDRMFTLDEVLRVFDHLITISSKPSNQYSAEYCTWAAATHSETLITFYSSVVTCQSTTTVFYHHISAIPGIRNKPGLMAKA